jgi:hypothetical protein
MTEWNGEKECGFESHDYNVSKRTTQGGGNPYTFPKGKDGVGMIKQLFTFNSLPLSINSLLKKSNRHQRRV